MQIGMIGLGRMGASMVTRLLRGGHDCVVHDQKPEGMVRLVVIGATSGATLQQFVDSRKLPRTVWLMAPAAAVDALLEQLTPLLQPGDIVIDGGNSHYHDDLRRTAALAARLQREGVDAFTVSWHTLLTRIREKCAMPGSRA